MLFNDRVSKYQNKLNDTDDMIVDYITKNKNEVVNLTIKELSGKIFVAPNSIMRFCRKLDYEGYSQLKVLLKQELSSNDNLTLKKGIEIDVIKTLELIDYNAIEKTANLLKKSKNIVIYGKGQNTLTSKIFYKELSLIFKNTFFFSQRHELIYKVKSLTQSDTLFLISQSGETNEILEIANEAKAKGCKIISLTNMCQNSLKNSSDISLFCYSDTINVNNYEIQNNASFVIVLRIIIEQIIKFL